MQLPSWHVPVLLDVAPPSVRISFRRQRSIWLGLMVWFRRVVFAGLVACAVRVPLAQTQSSANLSPSSISGSVAPSDSATQSGSSLQSGLVAGRKNTLKSTGASSARSMLASGSDPGEAQGACFQPGFGWQRRPQTSANSTRQTSAQGSDAATLARGSSVGAKSGTVNALPSGAGQSNLDQCPGIMTSATAPGAVAETSVVGEQSKTANSDIRDTSANAGTKDWLKADTLLNPAGSIASTQLTMGLTSGLSSKHSSSGTGPNASASSIQAFETRAYMSPIKLRRMMRSAPDLETRLKLRELSERQTQKTKKANKSTEGCSPHKINGNQSTSNSLSDNADPGAHKNRCPDQ
jgi:hypothetical protein